MPPRGTVTPGILKVDKAIPVWWIVAVKGLNISQFRKLLLPALTAGIAVMFSCGDMYSDFKEFKAMLLYPNDGYVGGSLLGVPLVYTSNSQCMGGQGWDAGPIYPTYREGIGGITCGVPDPVFSCWSGAFGIATDGTYLYVYDRDNRRLRTIDIATQQSATVAGNGSIGDADGVGTSATLTNFLFITYGGDGYVYMTDNARNTIRRFNTSTYEVATIAGLPGVSGSADGIGAAALFNAPLGITTDGRGYLYIADSGNNTIRKMNLVTGQVTTIAGQVGVAGTVNGTGSAARFEILMGMTTDGTRLYILQGWGKNCIRTLNLATLEVTTLAGDPAVPGTLDGTGTGAHFDNLYNVACDGPNLYTVDWDCGQVRKVVIATGEVTSLGFGVGNNTGICYDGSRLYITAPNYNQINAYW